ncbi:MAG: CsgG/HfaB family protein [Victivallaceae bacterium]|nr:CsgG/HfaB family protein [Victivallaceae bacterium]
MKRKLCILLVTLTVACLFAEEKAQTQVVPTVAVLPFEARERGAANTDMGKSVAELLNIALMESGCADLVERAELDKALNELQLSATGLTDKSSQVKLGRLIGAKILLTGSLFKSRDKNFVIVKIIGTETSRVLGTSVSGTDDFTAMIPELAPKVAAILEKQSAKLLPKVESVTSVVDLLKESIKGNQRKVYVHIHEDISVSVPDPAAETELKKILLALGFQVVDNAADANFVVRGEALAASAGNYHNFTSASARVELSIDGKGKKLLATGAAKETLAGATYVIAAKDAIAQATLRLTGELFGELK